MIEIAFDRVSIIRPDGTGLTSLTTSTPEGLCCPVWSPDGSMLIAQSGQPDQGTVDLWLARADGGGVTQLTHHPGAYKWYAWSPASLPSSP